MIPQGSALLNTEFFSNVTESLNQVQTCEELQKIVADAFECLAATKAAMLAELAKIQPLLDLLTVPAVDPSKIVLWIKNYIENMLTPMLKPTIIYAAQLAALAAQITALIDAIEHARLRIPSCSISVPTI